MIPTVLQVRKFISTNKNGILIFSDDIEKAMRSLFDIKGEKDVRLWNKYMSNTFEPLNNPNNTVQDSGLYEGQVRLKYFMVCF